MRYSLQSAHRVRVHCLDDSRKGGIIVPALSSKARRNTSGKHANLPLIERDEIIGSAAGRLDQASRSKFRSGWLLILPHLEHNKGRGDLSNNHLYEV